MLLKAVTADGGYVPSFIDASRDRAWVVECVQRLTACFGVVEALFLGMQMAPLHLPLIMNVAGATLPLLNALSVDHALDVFKLFTRWLEQ
jgi:hypothetical protein